MNTSSTKATTARIKEIIKKTEDLDAPAPPRPPPPVFVPPAPDKVHNPSRRPWEQLIPDLSCLDDAFPGADVSSVRLVSVLELHVMRRQGRNHRSKWTIPMSNPGYRTGVFDSRGRLSACGIPESPDYTYITTAPYPEWMEDSNKRKEAIFELFLQEVGL